MATKIRLQRRGRKNYAFYQIVVADSRAPRDGKFIERIGSYNPNTNPATIDLNFERALYWLQVGAQPTDTTRNILSNEGVLMKKHLIEGVKKGAFDEAAMEAKFQAWAKSKQDSVNSLNEKNVEAAKADAKARFEAEKEVNKVIAEKVAKKKAELAAAKAEVEAAARAKEAPVVEAEAPAVEAVVEAPVETATETPAAEAVVETPVVEAATETPAAESAE
jgi:ribosomal protein S16